MVKTKSIYEPAEASDGYRVLVMHYWPRGVAKDRIDAWEKELGTPPELIERWKSKRIGWPQFRRDYIKALKGQEDKIAELAAQAKSRTVTLLCSCKDAPHCHRTILAELLEAPAGSPSRR